MTTTAEAETTETPAEPAIESLALALIGHIGEELLAGNAAFLAAFERVDGELPPVIIDPVAHDERPGITDDAIVAGVTARHLEARKATYRPNRFWGDEPPPDTSYYQPGMCPLCLDSGEICAGQVLLTCYAGHEPGCKADRCPNGCERKALSARAEPARISPGPRSGFWTPPPAARALHAVPRFRPSAGPGDTVTDMPAIRLEDGPPPMGELDEDATKAFAAFNEAHDAQPADPGYDTGTGDDR